MSDINEVRERLKCDAEDFTERSLAIPTANDIRALLADHARLAEELRSRSEHSSEVTAPPGYVLADRAQLEAVLDSVRSAMDAAFHRRSPECCGSYTPFGCCGNPREAWSEDDRETMDVLHPAEQTLAAMLAAAIQPK